MTHQNSINAINSICICCEKDIWQLIQNTDGGDYLCCKNCGYQIQSTHDSETRNKQFEDEQKKFYDKETVCLSPLFLSLEEQATSIRIKVLQKYLLKGKLFEVGPGSGHVLSRVLSLGYDVEAIEHSEVLAKNVQEKLGIKVKTGAFEAENFDNNLYDAYMSFHVIEHVSDVILHLQKANNIVKKGGFAFIATPNANSWEHKLPFALSPNYSTAHFQLFSKDSLAHCLEKSGWKIIKVTTPSYATSWLRVITAIMRKIKGNQKSAPRGEYMKSSNPNLSNAIKIFSFITSPFRFLQARMNYGNELFIVAIKQNKYS